MLKAILFDMDGTLLPMDAEAFTKKYFGALSAKFAPRGYDPEKMIGAVWQGVLAMVKNDGAQTNVLESLFRRVRRGGARGSASVRRVLRKGF